MIADDPETAPDGARSLAFAAHLNGHHDAEHDLRRAIERRTAEAVAVANDRLDRVADARGLRALQQDVRAAVMDSLGDVSAPGTVPFTRHGALRASGIRIEPIVYRPRERAHVTATLYTPTALTEPTGAVFLACGHTDEAKADPEYQLLARALCRAGLVVLVADPIGQGERHSYPADSDPHVGWGTREHTYAGVQTWWHGFSPARYFVEDALAGIALLRSLPEVDPERVGVTGHSGGGALVTLLCAVDERLAAAAPATFVTARDVSVLSGQAQDAEQIVLGGLARGVDHAQLLLCLAPRPVLVLAAAYDFFPLEGTLDTVRRCGAVLQRAGIAPVQLETAQAGHAYSSELREHAVEFFRRTLTPPPSAAAALSLDESLPRPAELAVFTQGVRAAHPQEMLIFERTIADADPAPSSTDSSTLDTARDWLRRAVTAGGDPAPARLPRWFPAIACPAGTACQGFWLTDRGVRTSAVFFTPTAHSKRLRIVVGSSTDDLTDRSELFDDADAATLVLDVRGTGAVRTWGRAAAGGEDIIGADYKVLCDLLSLGDSLEAARVRDVLHTVVGAADGLIPGHRFTRFELIGRGAGAFTASVAAAVCGPAVTIEVDERPRVDGDARSRDWDAAAGRWRWMLPGYAAAVGDALLDRLNDPVVGGEHGDLAVLGLVREALAHPPLPRIGDGDRR